MVGTAGVAGRVDWRLGGLFRGAALWPAQDDPGGEPLRRAWEGYAAEVVGGIAAGALLGWVWPHVVGGALTLNWWRGLLVGGLLAAATPLGDFFISLIKREVGVKDSGNLIPGHVGAGSD